ncbi:MAG: hypothetical protein M3R00_07115, partial [Pseudomonadota bacterium]|nr:hypothetical protein [Pseudomonadota bacterium]
MQKEINVDDQLVAIANTVWQVSCFGGNNLAKPKALGKIITAMVEHMLMRRNLVLKMREMKGLAVHDDQQLHFIEATK